MFAMSREANHHRERSGPLLRISSPLRRRRHENLSTFALVAGFFTGFLALALSPVAINVVAKGASTAASEPLVLAFGTLAFFSFVALVGGTILARRRTLDGSVLFDERVIYFYGYGAENAVVPWSDIETYRDGCADWIELVSPARRRRLLVPTRSEKDRVAVLEHLDRRGLTRLE